MASGQPLRATTSSSSLALEQHGQREGALQPADRRGRGLARGQPAAQISELTRCATTSVSVWVAKLVALRHQLGPQLRKFSMMPLCTSATPLR